MWLRVLVMVAAATASPRRTTCGFEACPAGMPGMLNVHLVPHIYDDANWLKTVDRFFFGAESDTQQAVGRHILDSVVEELDKDPARRFVYADMVLKAVSIWPWYQRQNNATRAAIHRLVNERRLEFIGGAWGMSDEACLNYNVVIDQMSVGIRTLFDNFGTCGTPRAAWQINPYGYTKEQVNLFAQMGFDGVFFGRIAYDDLQKRAADKNLEFVWQTAHGQGSDGDLFAGVIPPPPGHRYNASSKDQPSTDDKRPKASNVSEKVDNFIEFAKNKSKAYRSRHIMMTMGGDFNYQPANMWFKNMDKLIRHVNSRQEDGELVNVLYSTPSCYLKALHDSNNVTWPTFQGDFLSYASDPWAYWTGYFTSRPTQKRYIRKSNNVLQVCKQLTAIFQTEDPATIPNPVDLMRIAMAVNQHQDAVTGADKQRVADDYVMRLSKGTESCQDAISGSLSLAGLPEQSFCNQLNTSSCDVTERHDQFVVTVYNPLSRSVGHWVRLPVTGLSATVTDGDGKTIESQLSSIPEEVLRLPGRNSTATYELVFKANALPPLGFRSYFVKLSASIDANQHMRKKERSQPLSNGRVTLDLDPKTNRVVRISTGTAGITVNQSFVCYRGYGNITNSSWVPAHRLPVFNPVGEAKLIEPTGVEILKGPLVKELRHSFAETWLSQTTRLYSGEPYAEVEWQVGPIPIQDGIAKEIISRLDSDINSNDLFYTDSNGRQMMERRRNHGSARLLNVTEPVAWNYYPVNSRIYIKDANSQLTVLTDRSQGGTSLSSGRLELMLHRRTVQDDGLGRGEASEGLVVRGRHWLLVSSPADAPRLHRDLAERVFMAPQLSFSPADDTTVEQWTSSQTVKEFTGMNPLPANVHLLTLEAYKPGQLLIRLEHQYEANEDPELSRPVQVNLQNLFTTMNITSVAEFGLSGELPLTNISRFDWSRNQTGRSGDNGSDRTTDTGGDPFTVTLKPMEIRTFVANSTIRQ